MMRSRDASQRALLARRMEKYILCLVARLGAAGRRRPPLLDAPPVSRGAAFRCGSSASTLALLAADDPWTEASCAWAWPRLLSALLDVG